MTLPNHSLLIKHKDIRIKLPSLLDKAVCRETTPNNKFLDHLSYIKRIIIFSPHLDDALLSMGSFLHYLLYTKHAITVITFFTAGSSISSPLTKKLLQQSDHTDVQKYFSTRKSEDFHVLSKFGDIKTINLDFIDAAWRYANTKNPLYPITTLHTFHKKDEKLKEDILKQLKTHDFNPQGIIIFAPLGRGGHIDHVLTRDLSTKLFPQTIFYADFPYAQDATKEKAFIKVNHLTPIVYVGKKDFYQKKAEAIFDYKTQKASLFPKKTLYLPFETFYVPPHLSK